MNEEITLREVADYLDHVGIQFMATPHAIHGAGR